MPSGGGGGYVTFPSYDAIQLIALINWTELTQQTRDFVERALRK
jgi:hypothetical protein